MGSKGRRRHLSPGELVGVWPVRLVAFRLLEALLFTVVIAHARAETVALRGGSVFDAKTGVILPARTIVIEGERIQSITSQSMAQIPSGARVIDVHGKYIIPGLIDAHVHLVHV